MSIDWQGFVESMLAETNGKLQRVAIVTHQGTVLGRTESIEPAPEEIPLLLGIFEDSARLAGERPRFSISGTQCNGIGVDHDQQMAVFDWSRSMATVVVAKTKTTLLIAFSTTAVGCTSTMNTVAPYADRLRETGY